MTIKEAQEMVDTWVNTYGVRYFSELTNMACLTEEVGELARGIDLTEELKKSFDKKTKRDSERHHNNPKLTEHPTPSEDNKTLI